MGTLNAIYVRASNPSIAAAICAAYPTAYTEAGSEFFAIGQPDDRFDCPEGDLQSLSARLGTDVIWLSFQSVVDAFQYHHWSCGAMVRSLVYGCFLAEREWERAEGQPQPWEATALFNPDYLATALECANSEQERRKLEHIYHAHVIFPGAIEPSLEVRETARGVAEFYRLPGWSLSEEDTLSRG